MIGLGTRQRIRLKPKNNVYCLVAITKAAHGRLLLLLGALGGDKLQKILNFTIQHSAKSCQYVGI